MKKFFPILLLTIGLSFGFKTVQAAPVTCPDPVVNTGYVTVDTNPSSICHSYGDNNVDLSPLTLLDKTSDNNDLLEGVLTINQPSTGQGDFSIGATPGYINLVLVIKDGNLGGLQWGAFSLAALTGTWKLQDSTGKFMGLSGAELWGEASPLPGPSPVPVPAAVWLFGTALVGFIGLSRRTRV